MNAEQLYEMLKKVQEPKGYYFSDDAERVMDLMNGLLANKDRYGYMVCPCVYRTEDVAEYGSCYCNLYVSREWNEGKIPREYVPERRPVEMMF